MVQVPTYLNINETVHVVPRHWLQEEAGRSVCARLSALYTKIISAGPQQGHSVCTAHLALTLCACVVCAPLFALTYVSLGARIVCAPLPNLSAHTICAPLPSHTCYLFQHTHPMSFVLTLPLQSTQVCAMCT